jgi:hypothetical protein
MWPAGERLLTVADPQRWQETQAARRMVEQNRDVLARCVAASSEGQGRKTLPDQRGLAGRVMMRMLQPLNEIALGATYFP